MRLIVPVIGKQSSESEKHLKDDEGMGLSRFESHWPTPDYIDGDTLVGMAKAPLYLVKGLIEDEVHGIVGGSTGTFKTFWALRLAFSIATGEPFFDRKVYRTGKVLYACGEGAGGIARRLLALSIKFGVSIENICLYTKPLRFNDPLSMAELRGTIEELDPVMVMFDTWASLAGGIDENSPSSVGPCMAAVRHTCRGRSSLIIHHFGKDAEKGFRGASNFLADVDYAFAFKRDAAVVTMKCAKMKDGEMFEAIYFGAESIPLGLYDQECEEVTSLVAVPVMVAEVAPELIECSGSRTEQAVAMMRKLHSIKRKALREEDDHIDPLVSLEEWRNAMVEFGWTSRSVATDLKRVVDRSLVAQPEKGFFRPLRFEDTR